ncbi:MAG: CocE/NonD family hydrolase [Actinobacteria bacterium]|nr:CocE/NonD family hydrolase [Actinomycetota bacterium]
MIHDTDAGAYSSPVTVHDDTPAPWDPSIYTQSIASSGYQYLTTRDGTKLALTVHQPMNAGPGPYPTLVEYAGYGYANPSGPQSGLAKVANVMGFAVVDVNMRGTGCSGGAFDYFEMLQNLDAYDVIETIAAQPWVKNHKVGMFGISYGGISQLFAAQLNPPHLAAIAPLSVIDATASTLYPGGILNTGFAMSWAQGRVDDAKPATATTGQRWAWQRIQGGDTTCATNQVLHAQAADLMAKIRANPYYVASVADALDPVSFVHDIHMPVFLACQFQDEQTGGQCPELVRHLTGTDDKWAVFTNGVHTDSLDPATINQIFDFLQLFVAEQVPGQQNSLLKVAAPIIYQTALGVPNNVNITLPDDPIQQQTTYTGALAALRALPRVQVRFDNGAGSAPDGTYVAGAPYPAYTLGFSTLPVPGAQPRTWYLGDGHAMHDTPPTATGTDDYTSDASATNPTDYNGDTGGGGLWGDASQWDWNWQHHPTGTATSYLTPPLASNTTVVGTGSVNVWVRSSTPDVDLQATISEVRPDGNETFVQNGWIRASERKLSTDSNNVLKRPGTPDDPVPTFTQADAAPMPAGQYVPVTIPLYFQGHAYRTGSRIRVTISAPNGSQPVWAFAETVPSGSTSQVSIAHSPSMPSSLILPVVPGAAVPTGLPACPSLRNEPCRAYVGPAGPPADPAGPTGPTTPPSTTPPAPTTTAPTVPAPAPPSGIAPVATAVAVSPRYTG